MRKYSGNLADMWTETDVFREIEYLPGKMRARARLQKKELLNQPHCKHGE